MSDSMFQPSSYVVVRTSNFLPKNANLGGSKHAIPEIGQVSANLRINVQFITLE